MVANQDRAPAAPVASHLSEAAAGRRCGQAGPKANGGPSRLQAHRQYIRPRLGWTVRA